MNTILTELSNIFTALANNRINSGSPSTDDGSSYQPNFNLLDQGYSTTFDANTFFYICMILLAIVTLTSMMGTRRRGFGGNRSTLK
jgi:hypothetical protein